MFDIFIICIIVKKRIFNSSINSFLKYYLLEEPIPFSFKRKHDPTKKSQQNSKQIPIPVTQAKKKKRTLTHTQHAVVQGIDCLSASCFTKKSI